MKKIIAIVVTLASLTLGASESTQKSAKELLIRRELLLLDDAKFQSRTPQEQLQSVKKSLQVLKKDTQEFVKRTMQLRSDQRNTWWGQQKLERGKADLAEIANLLVQLESSASIDDFRRYLQSELEKLK